MVDNTNNGDDPDLEDGVFDEADFDDAYFDESAFDEAAYDETDVDISDLELESAEFDIPEWEGADDQGADDIEDVDIEGYSEEDFQAAAPARRRSRGSGKSFLSFNTMVIGGAVLVGAAVMMFTVMDKSGQPQNTGGSSFRSMLNIGEIMDGGLFGGNEGERTAMPQDTASEQPVGAETGFQEAGPGGQDSGFLNNPELVDRGLEGLPADDQALTPMPDDLADMMRQPRGPDEFAAMPDDNVDNDTIAGSEADTPAVTSSAEEILRRAMANREARDARDAASPDDMPAIIEEEVEIADELLAAAETPVTINPPETQEAVQQQPAPVPVPSVPVADTSPPSPAAQMVIPKDVAKREELETLESKIDQLLNRMEHIESELGSVRNTQAASAAAPAPVAPRDDKEVQEIRQAVQSLRQELATLKKTAASTPSAPASQAQATKKAEPKPAAAARSTASSSPSTPSRQAVAPQAAPPPRPATKPTPPPAPARQPAPRVPAQQQAVAVSPASPQWELRAAQPGKVWLSRPGERDMESVVVGDTLPGLGRINSIVYEGGRWTVYGAQGQVRQ